MQLGSGTGQWAALYVDGVRMQNTSFEGNIQTDKWSHVHLEALAPFAKDVTFMCRAVPTEFTKPTGYDRVGVKINSSPQARI